MTRGNIGESLRGVRGIERVGEQHGVVDGAAQFDSKAAENMERQLPIVDPLGHRRILKQSSQLRR